MLVYILFLELKALIVVSFVLITHNSTFMTEEFKKEYHTLFFMQYSVLTTNARLKNIGYKWKYICLKLSFCKINKVYAVICSVVQGI